jgi:hypothetical protein
MSAPTQLALVLISSQSSIIAASCGLVFSVHVAATRSWPKSTTLVESGHRIRKSPVVKRPQAAEI